MKSSIEEDGSWDINLMVLNGLKLELILFVSHLLNIIALCTSRSVDFL